MGALGNRMRELARRHAARSGSLNRKLQFASRLERDLRTLGEGVNNPRNLSARHLRRLVEELWRPSVTTRTLHNLVSHYRVMHAWAGSRNRLPDNAALGIPPRRRVPTEEDADGGSVPRDWGLALTREHLDAVEEWLRPVLELEAAFGLRRKEALKLRPAVAWERQSSAGARYGRLHLQGTWCKGGRPRVLPVETRAQAELLVRCCALVRAAESKSMIRDDAVTYRQAEARYDRGMRGVGFRGHQFRHEYAIRQYERVTGWPPPVRGGPSTASLGSAEREIDRAARLEVARRLGHGRIRIVDQYCGA